jgi:hypothetical protein
MTTMVSNDFMLQLHKQLLEKTYGKDNKQSISETTANAYIRTLFTLNDKKPFKTLTFLKKREEIDKKIAEYAESTQKTLYASITSVLSLYKDKSAYKATYKYYYDKMMAKTEIAGGADTSVKTETQKNNWVEWSEVEQKRIELYKKADGFSAEKSLTPAEKNTLLQLMVLSLYTDVPPRRNQDYLCMKVVRTKAEKFNPPLDTYKDDNFLVIRKNAPEEFVFNKYKTSKKYGSQTVKIPAEMKRPIEMYLKHHPLARDKKVKEFKFLVSADGAPITQPNAITRILNSIFAKKIGSSMLRHIYLSSKMNINEMKNNATAMGHSLTEQQKYLKADSPPHIDSDEEPPFQYS